MNNVIITISVIAIVGCISAGLAVLIINLIDIWDDKKHDDDTSTED